MSWSDEDIARRTQKFLKAGVLHPEDVTKNELRLLGKYFPKEHHFVKWWLENRHQMIKDGEWTEDHEPPDSERRIKRYERGEAIVEPWEAQE